MSIGIENGQLVVRCEDISF